TMMLSAAVIATHVTRDREMKGRALAGLVGAFALCYVTLILASKTLVGHEIPLDDRMLSPLLVAGALLLAAALAHVWRSWRVPLRIVAAASAIAWTAGATMSARDLLEDIRTNGYDYASLGWRTSETLAWLRRDGAALTLYTNHPVP